ncbi:MAG: pyridoxal phosphate-dependent aminotransferase family protein [Pseudomonadota bacterium]
MLDFSSALYLGMRHPSTALGRWDALTLGRPAALTPPPGAARLAAALASLCGCEAASLLPSTLHLFWDLFDLLSEQPLHLLVDAASYPIARWGAERAVAKGANVSTFAHGDAHALQLLAQRARSKGLRPVILADGFSPGHAAPAPLAHYAAVAKACDGWLVIDDTQALGLFGARGGGSLPLHGLEGEHVVIGASLAKAFGAPLAVLAGTAALVGRFDEQAKGRVHTSPPSVAAIRAGLNALRINRALGDALRWRLWRNVALWQARIGAPRRWRFPVQVLALPPDIDAVLLHASLREAGMQAVLQGTHTLSVIVTAMHARRDIEAGADLVGSCMRQQSRFKRRAYGTRV